MRLTKCGLFDIIYMDYYDERKIVKGFKVERTNVYMKDTSKIVEELGLCSDFRTFYDENKEYMIKEDLPTLLSGLLQKHGLKKSEVIRNSEMSEVYAYQIFSGVRVPERKKLLCLAVAMNLPLDEVQTLLKCAGYPTLYVKIPFDCIVMHGICNKMTIIEINKMLFEYGAETLG